MSKSVSATLYYAVWCGHCKRMKPDWERVVKICKENKDYITNKYNLVLACNSYDADKDNEVELAGINGFPTIHINEEIYNGERSTAAILRAILKHGTSNDAIESDISKWCNNGYDKVKKLETPILDSLTGFQAGGKYDSITLYYKYMKYKKKYNQIKMKMI